MSKGNSLLEGSTADYSAVCKEIANGASNPAPRKQAEALAKLISSDKAFNKDGGSINASRFIRAVMAEYIPASVKVTPKSDRTAYDYFCNVRRLTKRALGFKAPTAHAVLSGIEALVSRVNKLENVADIQRIIEALNARKAAIAKAQKAA